MLRFFMIKLISFNFSPFLTLILYAVIVKRDAISIQVTCKLENAKKKTIFEFISSKTIFSIPTANKDQTTFCLVKVKKT